MREGNFIYTKDWIPSEELLEELQAHCGEEGREGKASDQSWGPAFCSVAPFPPCRAIV